MKLPVLFASVLSLGVLMSGCDWTSSGQDGGWSSNYENMSFSGVYRGRNGGPVLSGGATGGPGEEEALVSNEQFATGNGASTSFSATLKTPPIIPGSVTVSYGAPGAQSFTDNGNAGLVGSSGGSGTINYASGAISLQTGGAAVGINVPIRATYRYRRSMPDTPPGSLLNLTVTQTGQRLDILTSSGIRFSGKFGGINSSGIRQDAIEDVVSEFSATAVHQGRTIRLAGVFQTTLTHYYDVSIDDSGVETRTGSWFTTSARVINASWIEPDGTVLDVYAEAPSQEVRRTN